MPTEWYPVIDGEKCNNCRVCLDFCGCGVFEISNDRVIVAYPEACIWECTKCEDKCPEDCIQYQFTVI